MIAKSDSGRWVLFSFIGFFIVIIAVNAIFITTALKTHSGVITDQPYEKGLHFDETLAKAASQPSIIQEVSYEDAILRWSLKDEKGAPLTANVSAKLVWPIKSGHDFEIPLIQTETGHYEATITLPFKGQWDALLKAQWNNTQYQTRTTITSR